MVTRMVEKIRQFGLTLDNSCCSSLHSFSFFRSSEKDDFLFMTSASLLTACRRQKGGNVLHQNQTNCETGHCQKNRNSSDCGKAHVSMHPHHFLHRLLISQVLPQLHELSVLQGAAAQLHLFQFYNIPNQEHMRFLICCHCCYTHRCKRVTRGWWLCQLSLKFRPFCQYQ